MSPAEAEALVPLAAELVGCIRDYSPEDTGAALNRAGIFDPKARALAVVLAAMVDPDQSPANLLAWTTAGPVQSRDGRPDMFSHPLPREHGSERGYQQHRSRKDMPACAPCRAAHRAVENARTKARAGAAA